MEITSIFLRIAMENDYLGDKNTQKSMLVVSIL